MSRAKVAYLKAPALRTARYVAQRIDMRLKLEDAQTLRDIQDGLEEVKATLEDGSMVDTHSKAIVWMLQNIRMMRVETFMKASVNAITKADRGLPEGATELEKAMHDEDILDGQTASKGVIDMAKMIDNARG